MARSLDLKIQPDSQVLAGMGNSITKPLGRTSTLMFTPTMTLEIDFLIVPDGSIPGVGVDALIDLDVLKRPGIKIDFNANSVDIVYDPLILPRICTIYAFEDSDLNLSGLDERMSEEIKTILQNAIKQTPAAVTTTKLKITLRDSNPVAYKPRHLSYAERLQVKQIINEQIHNGIIRPSESPYASPIVLVKKKKWRHKVMCGLS